MSVLLHFPIFYCEDFINVERNIYVFGSFLSIYLQKFSISYFQTLPWGFYVEDSIYFPEKNQYYFAKLNESIYGFMLLCVNTT